MLSEIFIQEHYILTVRLFKSNNISVPLSAVYGQSIPVHALGRFLQIR